jgi:hypothetical protein
MKRTVLVASLSAMLVGTSYVATTATASALPPTLPFSTLAPGFTQQLYATGLPPFFGIGFASNGDVFASEGTLFRIDSHSTVVVHGSTIHPTSVVPGTSVGFGLTNTADGGLWANANGAQQLDPATGATIGSPLGQGDGGFLGIEPDPQTGNLVYQDNANGISFVSPTGSPTGTFSQVQPDGIAFDPAGNFLFAATPPSITVVNRSGAVVQTINLSVGVGPDGMAFHAGSPGFLLSNNNDGTITRYDFPGGDYSKAPTQSLFASGGTRGDLTGVGQDGCLYVSQQGTQFADGTLDGGSGSIVKICGGFIPPACATTITGTHAGFTATAGTTTCVSNATITGGISVGKGAVLNMSNSTVKGGIASNGASSITICGSTTGGISISGTAGPVTIGDPSNGCKTNTINGSLTAVNNHGGTTIVNDKITGTWTIAGNTPPVVVAGLHH